MRSLTLLRSAWDVETFAATGWRNSNGFLHSRVDSRTLYEVNTEPLRRKSLAASANRWSMRMYEVSLLTGSETRSYAKDQASS